jgi:tetratricopeptide (TPR) repeat protein
MRSVFLGRNAPVAKNTGGSSKPIVGKKAAGSTAAELEPHINYLLVRGRTREALDIAKAQLKQTPGPELELLVVRCYRARADELLAGGGEAEARQILAYATERFPKHAGFLNKTAAEKERTSPAGAPVPQKSFAAADFVADVERRVEHLLRTGATREALEVAKTLLKKNPGETAELLVIQCYQARARELYARGQMSDAQQLFAHAVARFPHQAHRIGFKHLAASMPATATSVTIGKLAELLKEAGQTETTVERRRVLAASIAKILHDPRDLLESEALPVDNPWRREAEMVWRVLEAVTMRPTTETDLTDLNGVSRHSPVAAWKLLVRTLRAYYQGRVEGVAANMAAVPENSPVRALAEPLRILTAPSPPANVSAELEQTLQELSGGLWDLQRRMEKAEKALRAGKLDEGYEAVAVPLRLLRDRNPLLALEMTVGLGRCVLENLGTSLEEFVQAQTKYLYPSATASTAERAAAAQAAALAMEKTEPQDASFFWRIFLDVKASASVQERLMPSEIRLVRCRLASLAATIPPDNDARLENGADDEDFSDDEEDGDSEDDADLPVPFDPEAQQAALRASIEQYELALAAEPDSRTYEQLYCSWRSLGEKEAESAAEQWHAAFPREIKPLLILMKATEKRDALHKALAYLAEAERLNPLHAEVRTARLRLQYAQFRKHLSAGQRSLAENDVKRMRFEAGDSTALVAQALRFVLTFASFSAAPHDDSLQRKLEECATALRTVHRHPLVAPLMAMNMVADCAVVSTNDHNWSERITCRLALPAIGEGADVEAVCETSELLRMLGVLSFWVTEEQRKACETVVATHPTVTELLNVRICRLFQPQLWPTLVYLASGRGLAQGRAYAHLFLFKRGLAMEAAGLTHIQRLDECHHAAATLAQSARDAEIADFAAKELWRLLNAPELIPGFAKLPLTPPPPLDAKAIAKIIKRESEPPLRNAQGEWILPSAKKRRTAGLHNFKRLLRKKP